MSAKHTKKSAASLSKVALAAHRKKAAAFQKKVLKQLKLVLSAPPKTYKMSVHLRHLDSAGKLQNIVTHYPPSPPN
jgi:hypothetical protein